MSPRSVKAQKSAFKVCTMEDTKVLRAITKRTKRTTRTVFTMRVRRIMRKTLKPVTLATFESLDAATMSETILRITL